MTHHDRSPCSAMPSETQRIVTLADHEALSRAACEILVRAIHWKPDSLLCAAAGSTPSRAYDLLIEHQNSFPKLFEKLRIVQLDEWFGLLENHPALCSSQVRRQLLTPLKISDDRFIVFASNAQDAEAECRRFAADLVLAGPIDLCVLGLGVNGHIAFNEPAPWLEPHVHVAKLSESSLQHPMVQHTNAKPTSGLTIGMSDILASSESDRALR